MPRPGVRVKRQTDLPSRVATAPRTGDVGLTMGPPTMRQVAERAGVSTALVSLVMREAPNVSDHRRALVLRTAAELGYRPNVLARNLASRRTRTIGVVLNDLHNPFFAEIVDGLQQAADDGGYRVLIGNGKHSRAGEMESVETFLQFRVDGLVLTGSMIPISKMELASASAALVVIGRTTRSRMLDSVNTDDFLGARLAVEHLLDLGHELVAHIGGGRGAGSAARRRGYLAAMQAQSLLRLAVTVGGDFTEEGGFDAATRLLAHSPRPTALFASNDLSAVGAIDAVEHAGLRVPEDISIAGYDNTALAAMKHMSLTSVNQPTKDLGQVAVDLLLQRLEDSRVERVHHVVAPALVVRSSTAPPPRPLTRR